ncbi:MAG: CPBP family intramembrane glutamic endopeptidase [Actinomycetota bacterium]
MGQRLDETESAHAIPSRRVLREEILVVLSLSLLASAVFAVIDLLSAPLHGVAVATFGQNVQLATQLAGIAFGLAPVWLVVHLLRRSGEDVSAIGLSLDRPRFDVAAGVGLAAVVGAAGIGIYLAAVALDVNRIVVPVPPTGHWWTVPVLILGSAQFALLEETIAIGYLLTRLRQLGWAPAVAVAASALLRGSYHLYQGWGGFAGNLAMGLFFGAIFLRWRRVWPLVVAHFLVDVGAGVGYLLFHQHLPGLQ